MASSAATKSDSAGTKNGSAATRKTRSIEARRPTLDDLTFGSKRRRGNTVTRTFTSTFTHETDGVFTVSGVVSLLDDKQWVITSLTVSGERGVPTRVRQAIPLRSVVWGAAAADLDGEPPKFELPQGSKRITADIEFLTRLSDRLRWLGTKHWDPVKVLAQEAGIDPQDSRLGIWLKSARDLGLLSASLTARAS